MYNNADITWTLASTAIVWLMIPGVGLFYSGLLRRKIVLSHIYFLVGVIGVLVPSFVVRNFSGLQSSRLLMRFKFQWLLRGDPLTFSNGNNEYVDLGDSAFKIVECHPSIGSTRVSLWDSAIYQCFFAAITYVFTLVRLLGLT